MARRASSGRLSGGLFVVLSCSCNVYNTSLLQDGEAGSGGAAGSSGSSGSPGSSCDSGECFWSGELPSGCHSAGSPKEEHRPSGTDPTELPPIYVGLERMRLGTSLPDGTEDPNAWQGFGLDLDGICTNSSTCPDVVDAVSCQSLSPQLPFDGADCRDNTFARLQPIAGALPEIGQTFGLSEEVINCGIWNGAYNIIAKISGYNGTDNDESVRIDFYASPGLEMDTGWECPLADFESVYPRWRVSSPWLVALDDLAEPFVAPGELPNSKYADAAAFVANGYFVARLPDGAPLNLAGDNFAFPGFNLRIQKGLWTGRIEKAQDGTWLVKDGLSVGRVLKPDLVNSFKEIGFCEDQGIFFDTLNTYVDENADVLADGSTDPTRACDAMSVGIAFEAVQLTPGTAVALQPPPGCPMN